MDGMILELECFLVTVNSPRIDSLSLLKSLRSGRSGKGKVRENAEQEKPKREQQRLIGQQAVNSAEANAEAKHLEAGAEAFRVITETQAEAEAIRLFNERLGQSLPCVKLVLAKRSNGK